MSDHSLSDKFSVESNKAEIYTNNLARSLGEILGKDFADTVSFSSSLTEHDGGIVSISVNHLALFFKMLLCDVFGRYSISVDLSRSPLDFDIRLSGSFDLTDEQKSKLESVALAAGFTLSFGKDILLRAALVTSKFVALRAISTSEIASLFKFVFYE